jgi:hypothetical protein
MNNRYSLHKIINPENMGFSKIEYSKFKFGDGKVAEKFGIDLAKNFIADCLSEGYDNKQIVVVSSPYSFIPTATFYLKMHFVFELNKWLIANNFPVVQETKIHRFTSYSEDYGAMSALERMKLISNDNFHFDKGFVEEKLILFLDDIRITGSHEKVIISMLSKLKINCQYYLLYFAELINWELPPTIENDLNYSFVDSIYKLDEIISAGRFEVNTRIVKYILNYEHESFKIFIQNKNSYFKNLIFNMAVGNSYHNVKSYKANFLYLQEIIFSNNKNSIINVN